MNRTSIEWADVTWNPITGCTPVSEGCQNCYAKRMAQRLRGRCGYPEDEPFRVTVHENRLKEPLKWRKPRMVFVCSMGDLFHEDIDPEDIQDALWYMEQASQHTFLILTKRPDNARTYLRVFYSQRTMPENIWFGVTAENQQRADERIPILCEIPAAVRFVSVEPMLGPVRIKTLRELHEGAAGMNLDPAFFSFNNINPNGLDVDWIICGGETGPGARPMHPDWVRSLRDQCQDAEVPFFFKQMGGPRRRPNDGLLDGREWREMPVRK